MIDPSVRRLWTLRALLLLPAVLVVAFAIPRLASGIAQEAALPATDYIVINIPLPRWSYGVAARALSQAPSADGDTGCLAAEAALQAGRPADRVLPIAREALTHAPANARCWMVLAELLRHSDGKRAAAAIALSMELAPREYYLSVPRLIAAAPVWRDLPDDAQTKIVAQAGEIARNRGARAVLLTLLATEGGASLVTRAFAGHPDDVRELNRSLVKERLRHH